MRFYNSRNFHRNFALVFINQFYYIFSSYETLSLRNILHFLSKISTFDSVTSTKYFYSGRGYQLLPSIKTHHIYIIYAIDFCKNWTSTKYSASLIITPSDSCCLVIFTLPFLSLILSRNPTQENIFLSSLTKLWKIEALPITDNAINQIKPQQLLVTQNALN